MTFERTANMKTVRRIMTHPRIYPHITDDLAPPREKFRPAEHPAIWYVLVRDGRTLLGLWMFSPENSVCWHVHTCLLPVAWGPRGKQAAQEMAAWIFQNTPCLRIVTSVPIDNRLALRFAQEAGMKQFGINERSYLKGGELRDQVLLGLNKPAPTYMLNQSVITSVGENHACGIEITPLH